MKSSFQIFRGVSVAAGSQTITTDRARQDYDRVTKIFIMPATATTDLSKMTIGLKIGNTEILPRDFDASLITYNGNVAREEVAYDFTQENIPAKSADIEIVCQNNGTAAQEFNIYLVVENN